MSSPRPSITSLTTASSSRRPSFDAQSPRPEVPSSSLPSSQRRNRTALRDYYKLKNASSAVEASSNNGAQAQREEEGAVRDSELDAEGFDAEGYVKGILAREGLEGLLKIEGGLINAIKGLDGERKALVYDNYSKLITATDTIRKMRTNMDPLTPTTSTLSPAISHIAETAASLASSLPFQGGLDIEGAGKYDQGAAATMKLQQQDTVRWLLAAPRRLRILIDTGRGEEAADDWDEIQRLLGIWKGVDGVEAITNECMVVMGSQESKGEE